MAFRNFPFLVVKNGCSQAVDADTGTVLDTVQHPLLPNQQPMQIFQHYPVQLTKHKRKSKNYTVMMTPAGIVYLMYKNETYQTDVKEHVDFEFI